MKELRRAVVRFSFMVKRERKRGEERGRDRFRNLQQSDSVHLEKELERESLNKLSVIENVRARGKQRERNKQRVRNSDLNGRVTEWKQTDSLLFVPDKSVLWSSFAHLEKEKEREWYEKAKRKKGRQRYR